MDVPADAWQVGPWNRWAYVHVDEVVPTVPVAADPETHRPLPEGAPLELDADAPELDGLVVVHDGAVRLERYGGETTATSLHLSQSVGKSVLGLLTGVLAGAGRVDVATPVCDLVPEVAGSGYAGATLRHLLDMTAATAFSEAYEDGFWKYDVACAWHPPAPGADAETVLDFLAAIAPAADWSHGERFHYATPNTDLLGIAVERAGGAPLADLIARELWGPLGAEHDARLSVDRAGTATIGGGFCATTRDYARLAALVAEGGRGIVPRDWIDGLGRGPADAFARPVDPDIGGGTEGYGSQWWRRDGALAARGIHGQLLVADVETGVAIASLSTWPHAASRSRDAAQRAVVQRVRDALR